MRSTTPFFASHRWKVFLFVFVFPFMSLSAQLTWDTLGLTYGYDINDLKKGSGLEVFISSYDRKILRSTDAGDHWEVIHDAPHTTQAQTLMWNVGPDGSLYIIDRNLETLTQVRPDNSVLSLPVPPHVDEIRSIVVNNHNDLVVLADDDEDLAVLYRDSTNWQLLLSTPHLQSFFGGSLLRQNTAGDLFFTGGINTLYRLDAGAATFTPLYTGSSIKDIEFTNQGDIWLAHEEELRYSVDQGDSWNIILPEISSSIRELEIGNQRIYLAYGPNVLYSEDNGVSFLPLFEYQTSSPYPLRVRPLGDEEDILLIGACPHRQLFKENRATGVRTDLAQTLPYRGDLEIVLDLGLDSVFVKNCMDGIQLGTAGGTVWEPYLPIGTDTPFRYLGESIDGSLLLAISNKDSLYKSLDRGVSWINVTHDLEDAVTHDELLAIDENLLFAYRSTGAYRYSLDGGVTWSPHIFGLDNSGELIKAHPEGYFFFITGGALFAGEFIMHRFDPFSPDWVEVSADHSGPSLLQSIYEKYLLENGNIIINVAGSNSFDRFSYVSRDNHQTYQRVVGIDNHLTDPMVNAQGHVYAANTRNGGTVRSLDGGFTWERVDSVQLFFTPRAHLDESGHFYLYDDEGTIHRTAVSTVDPFSSRLELLLWETESPDDCEEFVEEEHSLLSDRLVRISGANSNFYNFTNADGFLSTAVPPGNYEVQPVFDPDFFTLCSSTIAIEIQPDSTVRLDIALEKTLDCPKLQIVGTVPSFRRCFENQYYVQLCNTGTATAEHPAITVAYDPALEFISSNVEPSSVNSETVAFALTDLPPGACTDILLSFQESCEFPLGTIYCFQSVCTTENDCTPSYGDLTHDFCTPSIGSFDPNDKRVFDEIGLIEDPVDPATTEKVTYMIRFQNTGTDTAFTVVLIDTLSADLDPSAFRLLNTSHPCEIAFSVAGTPETEFTNVLKFTFDNIRLPDSTTNPVASNGFASFEIGISEGVPPGTTVENFADIYFDFNEPVRTNTSTFTLALPNTVSARPSPKAWRYYPNPVRHTLKILAPVDSPRQPFQVNCYNRTGQLILQLNSDLKELEINTHDWLPGLYFIQITSAKYPISVSKIVKE